MKCDNMGKVIIIFKILPENPDNFNAIKAAIGELNPERIEEEPIAFGLKSLKVIFLIPDAGGEQDKLENRLNAISGIGSVETVSASRAL